VRNVARLEVVARRLRHGVYSLQRRQEDRLKCGGSRRRQQPAEHSNDAAISTAVSSNLGE
jgi:hypothetical protein